MFNIKLKSHLARAMCHQSKYHSKIEALVNNQIQMEQQAAQEYLNMAVCFLHPSKSMLGGGGFFMKMYQEELDHMRQFIHYQLLRRGDTLICGLKPPSNKNNISLLEAFKQGLEMEERLTKQLEKFVKIAEEEKDYHCANFLTTFLTEQIKSIHEMSVHVTKLTQIDQNIHALNHYDFEIAKAYPYSYNTNLSKLIG